MKTNPIKINPEDNITLIDEYNNENIVR